MRAWHVFTGIVEEGKLGGFKVEADILTIEVSGALTFWRSINEGQRSILVIGFNAGHWQTVELVDLEKV